MNNDDNAPTLRDLPALDLADEIGAITARSTGRAPARPAPAPIVSGRFVRSYSGRGGFPSGPYHDVELIDASGAVVGTTRTRAMTRNDAKHAARRLASRLGYSLGAVR